MYKFITIFYVCIFVVCSLTNNLYAQEQPRQEIGIVEYLGSSVPMDIVLKDEYGQAVKLSELIEDKPVVLSLVYYRCPGICSPLLNGVAESVNLVDLEPGKDFKVITVSFDPSEDYLMAADKKRNYLESIERKIPESSWRFLTADSINIKKITEAVGWGYKKEGVDYIHGAGIMVLSPEGKIARYLYGVTYLPTDLKMALIEASEGRVGTTISKLMLMCFSYDPDGRRYVLNVTRIAGGTILMILGVFAVVTIKKKKKKTINNI